MDEAQRALERFVKIAPSAAEAHAALGMVLLATGQRAGAKAEFERALRIEPDDLDTAKALAHIEAADYNGARVVALLKRHQTSPGFDDEARLLLASGFSESGDSRSAAALLAPALDRHPPPPPEVFVLAAASAYKAGDQQTAERACSIGLRAYLNSDDVEQRCLKVVSIEFVKSIEHELGRGNADLLSLVVAGRLMTDATDLAESPVREHGLQLLRQAVALNPSDPSALYNLGRCQRVLARSEEAIATLNHALAGRPDPELEMLIRTQIGRAEQFLQHDAAAESAFRRAFEINRGLPHPLPQAAFDYYSLLIRLNKNAEAAPVLDQILRWDAGFLPARLQRARMLADEGRLKEAAGEAGIVARNTDVANQTLLRSAHMLLLQVSTKLGRTAEAAEHQEWLRKAKADNKP